LSNDDAADRDPALTEAINHGAAVRLAELARQTGVPRLLYSSSCAVYGAAASGGVRTEESSRCR
jgi:nucleoside-diphosphate-sugar epimerase